MSILSQRCIYALRAVMYTATQSSGRPFVSIREMADALDISFHFLTKVLQDLTRAGLMVSHRGPAGGVSLIRTPKEITLRAIVEVIEGPDLFTRCLLGLDGCGDRKPCPMHDVWVIERERLEAIFTNTKLSDISPQILNKTLRLSN